MSDLPETVERCQTPRGEMQLQCRGSHYEIISNGTFLMATYQGDSEKALVRSALERVQCPRNLLIGGLGVGFSLAEALTDRRVEHVTVVEIEPDIVRWNRDVLAPFSNHALKDPRVHLVQADFIDWMEHTKNTFDLICLDIDNGPDWTVVDKNRRLYTEQGIRHLKSLLRPQGILSVWSASLSRRFVNCLEKFFEVKLESVPHFKGQHDWIYLARKSETAE
ncbi:spermine/spermidine synthase [Melghirimyces profundicolus]|uniref:Spermine/spermidine synthase n=1 Tax=Melghirimyces profundicolus TaxID=1242148 RepID=A0A2T6BG71_9BACL|nr:spermine/spermidine synthase [Melghirimyces profundicolus]PTX55046.1 spermine/spermidine synthase [Melghirimyces profundicolus]